MNKIKACFTKKKSRILFYNRNQWKARGLGLSTLHFFFLTGDDMGCGGVGSKRGLHQHLLSESCFKRSYGSLTCRILCQVFSYIHSFWRFFRKWPRVLFHANLFFMLIVHMHLKLENKWGYSLVNTKSGAGGNWLYFTPYLKAFPVFNVLETCRVYLLTIDLGIVKCVKKHTPILTEIKYQNSQARLKREKIINLMNTPKCGCNALQK